MGVVSLKIHQPRGGHESMQKAAILCYKFMESDMNWIEATKMDSHSPAACSPPNRLQEISGFLRPEKACMQSYSEYSFIHAFFNIVLYATQTCLLFYEFPKELHMAQQLLWHTHHGFISPLFDIPFPQCLPSLLTDFNYIVYTVSYSYVHTNTTVIRSQLHRKPFWRLTSL